MHCHVRRVALGVAASIGLLATQGAWAAQILTYTAFPITPNPALSDIDLVGAGAGKSLITGPGFQSNGDGLLPPAAQTAPGMDVATPFTIPGLPGAVVNANGSTDFYDAQLTITSLDVNGFASSVPVGGGNNLLIQNYASPPAGQASFAFFSTIAGGPVPLLLGTINNATLTGLQGDTATSVLSGSVTYTGGVIFNAMLAAGYSPHGGDMSISMLNLTDPNTGLPVGLSIAGDGYIADVNADATGLFDAPVPEPTTLAMAAFGLLPLMRRRRA